MAMRAPLPLLALAVLLAAGCGGGGPAREQPRLTQKQFASAANKVCINADRRVFRIGGLSRDPAGWALTVSAAKRGLEEMRALRPPAAADGGFAELLSLAQQEIDQLQLVHDALVKNDLEAARKAQTEATNDDTKIKKRAGKLGLTFCSKLLTNWPA